jgi:hypothetical protein
LFSMSLQQLTNMVTWRLEHSRIVHKLPQLVFGNKLKITRGLFVLYI